MSDSIPSPCTRALRASPLRHPVASVFLLGVLLRLLVFGFMRPSNNDDHYSVIRHILEQRELVIANVYEHSFHPQLYHVLALPFAWAGGPKGAQLLSLLLSLGTLWILRRLVEEPRLFSSPRFAAAALALPAFVPSFVAHGLYVANDTLAFFLGSLLALRVWRLLLCFSLRQALICSVLLGLGLSSKGTFLALAPPTGLLLAYALFHANLSRRAAIRGLCLCGLLVFALGSPKFIENQVHFGRPIVHNLDRRPAWAENQRPAYIGRRSLVDVNLLKLLKKPTVQNATRFSWPLMMYGSFWYKYWNAENNFNGYKTNWIYLGSALYLAGLIPSLALLLGIGRLLRAGLRSPEGLFQVYAAGCLLLSVALVLIAGAKYDVSSCFQSRLFYAAFFALPLALGQALTHAPRRAAHLLLLATALVSALSLFYFVVEVALLL